MASSGGGVAVVSTARELTRNGDVSYPFRADSYFSYLCGFPEPEALLVLVADAQPRAILFCRPRDAQREMWDGFRYGPEAARLRFGVEEAYPIESIDAMLPDLLANQAAVFTIRDALNPIEARLQGWLAHVQARERSGVTAPSVFFDLRRKLDGMRVIKSSPELDTMARAAAISASAHVRAMRATKPGINEYQIEAELIAEFRRLGARAEAYGSIVAGGANACVLHYWQNDQVLRDGDLLLIDAGCEYDGYASDITRTFPINGRFSGAQHELYQLVLNSQAAAIDAIRPGASFEAPHEAATHVLAEGMLALGLLSGTLGEVLAEGSYRKFFMHRTGHWLGMDVHDVGDYRAGERHDAQGGERPWRPLVPGMVLTVEPGIYVRRDSGAPEAFWDIGVRIEDDVVVGESGCAILSDGVPKEIADIEALMRAG